MKIYMKLLRIINKVCDHIGPLEIEKTVHDLGKDIDSDEDNETINIPDIPLSLNKNDLIQGRDKQNTEKDI